MKTNVSRYDFRGAFMASDTYKNNFSYDALGALYDYLTELEDDCGQEFDFDMVAICCDFAEYDDWQEFARNYDCFIEREGVENLDDLRDHTTVIPTTGNRFIIQQF
jgi:hypothetical protein